MTTQQLNAFQLRLQGYTYAQISRLTRYSEFTLRKYFSKEGRWHRDYQAWKSKEMPDIETTVHDMLIANATSASQSIIALLQSKNPNVILRAAQDILNRAGFAKNSRGFVNQSEFFDPAESIADWFEQRDENEKTLSQNQHNQ